MAAPLPANDELRKIVISHSFNVDPLCDGVDFILSNATFFECFGRDFYKFTHQQKLNRLSNVVWSLHFQDLFLSVDRESVTDGRNEVIIDFGYSFIIRTDGFQEGTYRKDELNCAIGLFKMNVQTSNFQEIPSICKSSQETPIFLGKTSEFDSRNCELQFNFRPKIGLFMPRLIGAMTLVLTPHISEN